MILKPAFFLSVIVLSLTPLVAQSAGSSGLRVGVAKVDITPTDMILNQMGTEPFEGVHDPIYARAIVIANDSETTAMVSLDLVDLPYDVKPLQERIQSEVGIAADHVIISTTHDHSAPHFSGDAPACQPNARDGVCAHKDRMQAYTESTSDKIIEALKSAKAALQPARMGVGTGSADVNVNRDLYTAKGWGMGSNPAGPSDKTVWVVKFETPQGQPIAILFNYAVHSIVTMDGVMVSGDLAGTAERIVEQRYGGNFVALFTLGSAGDQDPKFPEFPPPAWEKTMDRASLRKYLYSAMDAQGFILGAEVLRVADLTKATITAPHIAAAQTMLTCPTKPSGPGGPGGPGAGPGGPQPGAGGGQGGQGGPAPATSGTVPIQLSMLLIDQTAFVGVGGEVVTNINTHLKKASPLTNTIMVTIANGRAGYLADDASYDEPIFEVHGDPAARGCVENGIVDDLVKMIQQHL